MRMRSVVVLFVLAFAAGCSQAQVDSQVEPTALVASAPTMAATAIPSATPLPPTETASPTPTEAPTVTPAPPTATPLPSPTPTPDSVAGLAITDLRGGTYGGGTIEIGEVYNSTNAYTTYRIRYPAGNLRLTGLLHVPKGEGPFPVIIANRGHIDRERYQPGMDSRAFSDVAARNGYLVVAPDYRGYAGGDDAPNPFYTGYYVDTLHLIPMAQALPMARPGKVGMWGHSRGASTTVGVLTLTDQIAAAVVYAPAPADLAEDYARRFQQSGGNPGSDTWPFTPEQDPEAYQRVSPINFLDAVNAPVMLHHGTADTVVEASASVAIADALRALNKDVTLHLYEGQGHALKGEAEQLYFERTIAFFDSHMGR